MTNTKWRIAAIAIACIWAFYADEDDAFAKGQTAPASCTAASASVLGEGSSIADREHACALIRNNTRHRHG